MPPHPSMYVVDLDFAYIILPIIAHPAVMGFSFTSVTHPQHSSRTLFTALASRTHVKAPQTDFPAKPDNSSGSTYDSPSERPLRTKTTFQQKTAPKRHRGRQAVRGTPKPSTSQLSSMPHSGRESRPRPVGQHRDQDAIHLDAQSHGESKRSIETVPWLHASVTEAFKAWFGDRFRFLSLWKERFIFLSLSLEYLLEYPSIL